LLFIKNLLFFGVLLIPSLSISQVVVTTDQSFQKDVLHSKVPVLMDFWATWCGPCRMYGPVVDQIAKQYGKKLKVCRVNVDDNPSLSQQFKIQAIPASFIVKKGNIVDSWVGVVPLSEVQDRLKPFLKVSDPKINPTPASQSR
jgi:thioredoxin 1